MPSHMPVKQRLVVWTGSSTLPIVIDDDDDFTYAASPTYDSRSSPQPIHVPGSAQKKSRVLVTAPEPHAPRNNSSLSRRRREKGQDTLLDVVAPRDRKASKAKSRAKAPGYQYHSQTRPSIRERSPAEWSVAATCGEDLSRSRLDADWTANRRLPKQRPSQASSKSVADETASIGSWYERDQLSRFGMLPEAPEPPYSFRKNTVPPKPSFPRLPTPELPEVSCLDEFCACCPPVKHSLGEDWYQSRRAKMDAQGEFVRLAPLLAFCIYCRRDFLVSLP